MNVITEYNLCKKDLDNNIDIVIDVILSKLFYINWFNSNDFIFSYPRNDDMINYNIKQTTYYRSFQHHLKNIKVDQNGIIKDQDGFRYIDDNSLEFHIDKIELLDIDFKVLRKQFPILKRFSPKSFIEIIKKINDIDFSFKKFNYKYYDLDKWNIIKKRKGDWNSNFMFITNKRLFNIEESNLISKNNKNTNCKLKLNFNTKLGHIIFQNLHSVNYKLVPNIAYDLLKYKRGISYKIYKKLILPFFGKVNSPLDIRKINMLLNKNIRLDHLKNYSKKYMKQIEQIELITNVDMIKKNGLDLIDYERMKWKNK